MTARPTARRKAPSRVALTAATKADRKHRRQSLKKPLMDLRVADTTERRYVFAYMRLGLFLKGFLGPILSFSALDNAIAAYLCHIFEEGEPKSWSNDTVAAVQYFLPGARHRLALSWSLVKTWHRHELPARALPFTLELLGGFAGALLLAGEPRVAAGCIVGFSLLLRTSELLSLRVDDIVMERGWREAVVRLRDTKAGGRAAVHQSVVVRDLPTLTALRYLCFRRVGGDPLVPLSDSDLRRVFAHCVSCLRLGEFGIRPYSLRRGGATWLFRRTLSYDVVSDRGRWSNINTCRRYVEDGAAQLATLRLDEWQLAQVSALGRRYQSWSASVLEAFRSQADDK